MIYSVTMKAMAEGTGKWIETTLHYPTEQNMKLVFLPALIRAWATNPREDKVNIVLTYRNHSTILWVEHYEVQWGILRMKSKRYHNVWFSSILNFAFNLWYR